MAILYLFLWQVVVVVWRDLHRPGGGDPTTPTLSGRLIVLESGETSLQPGHPFLLRARTTLGRGPDNTIVLSDNFVSTNHATISYRDGHWWIADHEARNGTWVNDKRISGEARLQPGDVITMGRVRMRLAL